MRNSRATARDMLLSLGVLLVPAVIIYYLFARVPDQPPVEAADWKPVVAQARGEASFQVLAPAGLPDTWKPVRARYGNDELQLGFLGPDTIYHEVKQRAGARQPAFVKGVTRDGREEGTSQVIGRNWTRMISGDERSRCLVNEVSGPRPATTVVCGDTSYEGVEAFVSTLA